MFTITVVDANTFTYTFAGSSTTTASGTITARRTVATATTASPHGFSTGDSVVIQGAAQAQYDGPFTVTVTSPTTFSYTIPGVAVSPATGTIVAYKGNVTYLVSQGTSTTAITGAILNAVSGGQQYQPVLSGGSVALTATVTGVPQLTPQNSVTFIAEANEQAAIGNTIPFTPINLGTAILNNGTTMRSDPGNVLLPDVYELEAFYNSGPNYLASNSTPVTAGAGRNQAVQLMVESPSTTVQFVSATPASPGNSATVDFVWRVRPGLVGTTLTNQTGGLYGHIQLFVDGVLQGTFDGNADAMPGGTGTGRYTTTATGLSIATHTIVATYMGDAFGGSYMPSKASFTLTYTRASVLASALLAPSTGAVTFPTAQPRLDGRPAVRSRTTAPTASHVDAFFASASDSSGADGALATQVKATASKAMRLKRAASMSRDVFFSSKDLE
jgi:hypothetical protein